jgi:hypothetical protein
MTLDELIVAERQRARGDEPITIALRDQGAAKLRRVLVDMGIDTNDRAEMRGVLAGIALMVSVNPVLGAMPFSLMTQGATQAVITMIPPE